MTCVEVVPNVLFGYKPFHLMDVRIVTKTSQTVSNLFCILLANHVEGFNLVSIPKLHFKHEQTACNSMVKCRHEFIIFPHCTIFLKIPSFYFQYISSSKMK